MGKEVKKRPATKKRVSARRLAVAEGVVNGKSGSTIAESTGVDRRTVFRDLQSNELKLLLDRLLDAKRERMTRLLDLSLDAVEAALGATRIIAVAQGKGVQKLEEGGPDWFARLNAVRLFKELAIARRAIPREEEKGRSLVSLDELEGTLAKLNEQLRPTASPPS